MSSSLPTQVSRRTLVRGAAWSVPVVSIAAAAPAFAASPCDSIPGVIDWAVTGRYSRVSASVATYTIPDPDGAGPGQPLVLTITNTFLGSNTKLGFENSNNGNDNLRTFNNVGGSTATSLCLHQAPVRESDMVGTWTGDTNKSVTNFSFSRAVTGLTFTLRDIDSANGDFLDGIAITGAAFTPSIINSAFVQGTATTTDPLRAANDNTAVGDNSSNGNVNISMPTVTSFDLHYWNLESTASDSWWNNIDQDQKVFLSSFDFSYKPCG